MNINKPAIYTRFQPIIRKGLKQLLMEMERLVSLSPDESLSMRMRTSVDPSKYALAQKVWHTFTALCCAGVIPLPKSFSQKTAVDTVFECYLQKHYNGVDCCDCFQKIDGLSLEYYGETIARKFEISAARDKKEKFKRHYYWFIIRTPFKTCPSVTLVIQHHDKAHPSATRDLIGYLAEPQNGKVMFSNSFLISFPRKGYRSHVLSKQDAYAISNARASGDFIV